MTGEKASQRSELHALVQETSSLIDELKLIQEEEEEDILRAEKSNRLSKVLAVDRPEEVLISNLDRELSAGYIVSRISELMRNADPAFPWYGILRFQLLKEPLVGGSRGMGIIAFHNSSSANLFLHLVDHPGIKLSCKRITVCCKRNEARPTVSKFAKNFPIARIDLSLQNRQQLSEEGSCFEAIYSNDRAYSLKMVANATGAALSIVFCMDENGREWECIAVINATTVVHCMCDYMIIKHPSGAATTAQVFTSMYFEFSSPPILLRSVEGDPSSKSAAFSDSSPQVARFYYQGSKNLMKSSTVGTEDLLWEIATDGEYLAGWNHSIDPTAKSGTCAFGRATTWKLALKQPSVEMSKEIVTELKQFGFVGFRKLLVRPRIPCFNISAQQLYPAGLNWASVKTLLPFRICYLLHCLVAANKVDFSGAHQQRKMIQCLERIRSVEHRIAADVLTELYSSRIFDRSKDFCSAFNAAAIRIGASNQCNADLHEFNEEDTRKRRKIGEMGWIESRNDYRHMVSRVYVTPTRIVPCISANEVGNRMLRVYAQHTQRFLRVCFTNEEFVKCSGAVLNGEYLERIRTSMKEGIMIGGSLFKFLGYSNGQLREHGCWFFCEDNFFDMQQMRMSDIPTIKSVRESIGSLDVIRTEQHIGRYGARLGQAFSATTTSMEIPMEYVFGIDDVIRNGCCFSDGVGCISQKCADVFAEKTRLPYTPAAFQIRFGGCKGMVSVLNSTDYIDTVGMNYADQRDTHAASEVHRILSDSLDTHSIISHEGEPNWMLAVRPSMEKFDSTHNYLEYCTHAKCNKLFLNREIINILSSRGVHDDVFVQRVQSFLSNVDSIAKHTDSAIAVLREGGTWATQGAATALEVGEEVTHHKLFQEMASIVIQQRLVQLKKKAHIFVPHGCRLMGVMDETGLLQPGEVFIQHQQMPFLAEPATGVSDSSRVDAPNQSGKKESTHSDPFLLNVGRKPYKKYPLRIRTEERVAIGRNPCLHPGDIRVVKAVDIPALHHLFDVVVFPATGERPLPDMMGGGDLDGDDYFCIWDPELIPLEDYPPMVSSGDVLDCERRLKGKDSQRVDLEDWFLKYIMNENLGRICTAHVCWADLEPDGVKSATCLELARLQSIAVDFNKTGVPAIMPKHLTVHRRPDFLESDWKVSYESDRVLGRVYRMVREKLISLTSGETDMMQVQVVQNGTSDQLNRESLSEPLKWATFHTGIREGTDTYGSIKILLEYNKELLLSMRKYGVAKESEFLVGMQNTISFQRHRGHKRVECVDSQSAKELLSHDLHSLKVKFRSRFWLNVLKECRKEVLSARSAATDNATPTSSASDINLPSDTDLELRAMEAASCSWNDLKHNIPETLKIRVLRRAKSWILCTSNFPSDVQQPSWLCQSFPLLLSDMMADLAMEN